MSGPKTSSEGHSMAPRTTMADGPSHTSSFTGPGKLQTTEGWSWRTNYQWTFSSLTKGIKLGFNVCKPIHRLSWSSSFLLNNVEYIRIYIDIQLPPTNVYVYVHLHISYTLTLRFITMYTPKSLRTINTGLEGILILKETKPLINH